MSITPSAASRAAPPGDGPSGGAGRNLSLALVVIATAQLMVVLDATIVNVALPHIQRTLGFSGNGLEWVVKPLRSPSAACWAPLAFRKP